MGDFNINLLDNSNSSTNNENLLVFFEHAIDLMKKKQLAWQITQKALLFIYLLTSPEKCHSLFVETTLHTRVTTFQNLISIVKEWKKGENIRIVEIRQINTVVNNEVIKMTKELENIYKVKIENRNSENLQSELKKNYKCNQK